MADLGPKKIGSNYQKLLQVSSSTSETGIILDGSGSKFALRLSGSENVAIGTQPQSGSQLIVDGMISASIISASIGKFAANTIEIGSETFTKTHLADLKLGKSLLSGSNGRDIVTRRVTAVRDTDTFIQMGGTQDEIQFWGGNKRLLTLNQDIGRIQYGTPLGSLGAIFPDHIFQGNITASGDISASGTIYANDFQSGTGGSGIDFNDDLDVDGNIIASGSITATGNITAITGSFSHIINNAQNVTQTHYSASTFSGSIFVSGSAPGYPSTIAADGDISASGNLTIGQWIYHGGETPGQTGINMTDKRIQLKAGGISYIDINDSTGPPRDFTLNDGSNNVDFKIKGSSNNPLFKTDASANRIGMHGVGTPDAGLHIGDNLKVDSHITASGDISASGTLTVGSFTIDNLPTGNITASGVISASGAIIGNNIFANGGLLNGVQIGSTTPASYLKVDQIRINNKEIYSDGDLELNAVENIKIKKPLFLEKEITGSINAIGNINASGNISASGAIIGNYISVNSGLLNGVQIGSTTPASYLKVDNIVLNGNEISSDGTLHINSTTDIDVRKPTNFLKNIFVSGSNNSYGNHIGGQITATGNITASGTIKASGGMFTNLPTSPIGISTGDLYTFSGSAELGGVGAGGIYNQYTSSKFVLIK